MLTSALIYLLAAVIAVPIAKRLGLGSVLGYLIAGIIIGPSALQLVGDQTDVMHFAEFGVVIMLFLVGLELQPSRLWALRKPILGLGGSQVIITASVLAVLLMVLANLSWQVSLALGLTVALSSTAIVLQSLNERGLSKTQAGNNAFSVLLFQDIAIIPILALFPLLATLPLTQVEDHHAGNLIAHFPVWLRVVITFVAVGAIILLGRFLASPMFRLIAETRIRELFTAAALLIVVAIAVAMTAIGLSAALGTFLAGVVLAESEFRHELEADIEPFKGLLLGLFFITVGASINFALLADNVGLVLGLVFGLIIIKAIILWLLAKLFRMESKQGWLFTIALAQGGEFAFVLGAAGLQASVFDQHTVNILIIVVALSMLIAPLLFVAFEAWYGRLSQHASYHDDEDIEPTCDVLIAGYGRFGQIVGRMLASSDFHLTIIDHSPSQVNMLRRFGNTVFYGDMARRDLLEAAGAHEAKLLVIGVDDIEKCMEIIDVVQKHYPNLQILARAIDRQHAYRLLDKNIVSFERETFHSALKLGRTALKTLGVDSDRAKYIAKVFAKHDQESLLKLAKLWGDDQSYGAAVRNRVEDLKRVLAEDQTELVEQEQVEAEHLQSNKS